MGVIPLKPISHQSSSIVFSRKDAKSAKEFKFLGSNTKNDDSLCDLGVLGETYIFEVKPV